MAYNPGISYRGGDYIAAGISQGVESIVGGLMQRAKQRQQKEEWSKAAPQLQALVERLAPGSGIKVDKDTPKEMVPQLLQVAGSLQREQQEAPLRAIQLENEQLRRRISQRELDEAATNADALRGAAPMLRGETEAEMRQRGGMLAPGQTRGQMRAADPGAAFASYAERGGTDPRVLAQLGELAAASMNGEHKFKEQPKELTLPSGERVAWSPSTGSFSVLPSAPIPAGYERAQDGLRPVKGGPVEAERQTLTDKKNEARTQLFAGASNVIDTIDSAMPMVDELTSGIGGTVLNKIPGTKAKNLQKLIETVQANVGFDRLQQMRAASPTGGALGQVAVQELKALQASIASLDTEQTPAQLKKNLQRVRTHYGNWLSAVQGETATEVNGSATMSADDVLGKWLKKR